ncbi:hypothetical protein J4526_05105 [Desulfurococcaceae archaeon MEX13E-LK6-19]|nr:hypothetical protein J4526_05105 [Desulfurococcaceae archaeon MEX13E-LK6-19]
MNRVAVYALVIALLLTTFVSPVLSSDEVEHAYKRIAVIIVPGLSYNDVIKYYSNSSIIDLNKSSILEVEPFPPYTSLYYELSIVNGISWDLKQGIPLANKTLLVPGENKTYEPWVIVNQSIVDYAWGQWKTVFIGIHGIDVKRINNTVNFDYNITYKQIPPALFTLKINSSTKWDLINGTIYLFAENNTLKLKIDNETSDIKDNVSSIITLNITNSKYLEPGLYDIKFYVFKINNETYKLVTLGTIRRDQVFSANTIGFDKPITPHIPAGLMNDLTKEEFLFLARELTKFYKDIVSHVFTETGLTQTVLINYPLIEEAERILVSSNDGEFNNNLTSIIYKGLEDLVETIYNHLGKDETLVVLFSPYTYTKANDTLIDIEASSIITPGIVKYNDTLVDALLNNNIEFSIKTINGEKIILIDSDKVSFNKIVYGNGVLVLVNIDKKSIVETIDSNTVLGYIMSLSNVLGYGGVSLLEKYHSLSVEYNKLKTDYDILNATAEDLKRQINDLNKELGDVRADYENLTSKLAELEKELEAEKQKTSSLTTFLTAGMASIVVIAVIYGLIVRSIAKGGRSK